MGLGLPLSSSVSPISSCTTGPAAVARGGSPHHSNVTSKVADKPAGIDNLALSIVRLLQKIPSMFTNTERLVAPLRVLPGDSDPEGLPL
jgi:hypothetical protein